MSAEIHLALRFHVNFYHSYRGDTPDEKGFGKDIRIITRILDDLDRLNGEGIPVKGTWDIENYYSLEQLMPRWSPELINRMQERVKKGLDAQEPMSWNNGIVSAATEEEFSKITEWTVRNGQGSGLADLFESWEPVLRPQECMYTPSFLTRYPEKGINVISLYYSSHPFNGFSNFLPPLSIEEQYNPLRLKSRDLPGEMIMLPAYNNGDVADRWLSLRGWLKSMRKQQQAMENPRDLLLLLDMDADDEFWSGMEIPVLSRLFPSFDGLYRMMKSLEDLSWLRFTTPGEYLKDHEPVGEIRIDHDTADGSFDGLSSWAEKWTNTELWSILQESRRLSRYARHLTVGTDRPETIQKELDEAERAVILSMSTTHFGLTSPVMNRDRLKTAREWCEKARDHSRRAAEEALAAAPASVNGQDLILPKGAADRDFAGRGTLVRFRSGEELSEVRITGEDKKSCTSLSLNDNREYGFLYPGNGGSADSSGRKPVVTERGIGNGLVEVRKGEGGTADLFCGDRRINRPGFPSCSLRYGGRVLRAQDVSVTTEALTGELAALTCTGTVPLEGGKEVQWTHRYLVAADQPYIYADILVNWPETEHKKFNPGLADRLGTSWDGRWKEVMPWEFSPQLDCSAEQPLTVWKHNFFGDVTRYELDYYRFSKNRDLDSFNNHLTNGWVAVSGGTSGVLIAQSGLYDSNFAFCPMRLRHNGGNQLLNMNPFGTYHGKQYRYQTAASGLGRVLSLGLSDHLESYAPSYNGKTTQFSLMIAAYEGGRPDEGLRADAMLFAEPPLVI